MKGINHNKTISNQVMAMRNKYPHFNTVFDYQKMIVKGSLRPTSRSVLYQFTLEYDLNKILNIRITSPELVKNDRGEKIPHMYSAKYLCLYQPKYQEFKKSEFLSDTVIPWISLWLYFYELWHITGKWLGRGEHPSN